MAESNNDGDGGRDPLHERVRQIDCRLARARRTIQLILRTLDEGAETDLELEIEDVLKLIQKMMLEGDDDSCTL
jgi:hypothetical protein